MRTTTIAGIWNSSIAFMKANWAVILGLYFSAFVICGILGFLFLGSMFRQAAMAQDPTVLAGMIWGMMLRLLLFGLMAMAVIFGAMLSMMRHGLTNGLDSVGTNIGWALLGGLCLGLVYIVGYFALSMVMGIIMAAFGSAGMYAMQPGSGMSGGMMIVMLLFYALIIWLSCRLSTVVPNMAADRDVNPFTGIAKSWTMTSASQWTILGFFIVLGSAVVIIGGILIWILAQLGTIGMIMIFILYFAFMIFSASIPAGIFNQLRTDNAAEVFD